MKYLRGQDEWHYDPCNFRSHLHENFEIIYMVSGECTATVNKREYFLKHGDWLVVFPFQIHEYISEGEENKFLCISLTAFRLMEFFPSAFGQIPADAKLSSENVPSRLKMTSMSKANNYNLFASCTALGKIVPVGTVTDEKIFELSGLDQIGSNNNLQWTFQYCSSVEYIHLPGHGGGDSSFNGCSNLKAIWIGDDARPNDGFADLRSGKASTVYKSAFAGASGIHTLLLSDSTTRLAQETADFSSITTVYQATATAAANHCGSKAIYTQTLPQGLYGTTEE